MPIKWYICEAFMGHVGIWETKALNLWLLLALKAHTKSEKSKKDAAHSCKRDDV